MLLIQPHNQDHHRHHGHRLGNHASDEVQLQIQQQLQERYQQRMQAQRQRQQQRQQHRAGARQSQSKQCQRRQLQQSSRPASACTKPVVNTDTHGRPSVHRCRERTQTPSKEQSQPRNKAHAHARAQQSADDGTETNETPIGTQQDLIVTQYVQTITSDTDQGMSCMEVACLGKAFSRFQRALHITLNLSATQPNFVFHQYLTPQTDAEHQQQQQEPARFFSNGEGDIIYHQGLRVDSLLRRLPMDANPRQRLSLVVVSLLFNMAACFHLKAISSFDRRVQNISFHKAQRFYAKAHSCLLDAYPKLANTTSVGDDEVDFLFLVLLNNLSSAASTISSRRQSVSVDVLHQDEREPSYAEQLITFAQNVPRSTQRIEQCRKTFLLHALLVRERPTNLAPAA
uniref:Uncharacterized protein n=1 Tax=Craspedostauros australis TaxID=1486917 RepID=A0A7R9ZMP6_9STRA|mmetsp:Transcript_19267/g.53565  ORF Transcript_19267/g.53565 Transcript_19267/m.53565 type:complete len:399 (+) Transcript_19267:442-1638(+)